MPATGQRTQDYQGAAPQDGPAGRVRLALAAGAGPRSVAEVEALLRRRLRFISLVAIAVYGIASAVYLAQVVREPGPFTQLWLEPTLNWAVFLAVALLAAILHTRRPLSLGRLRMIEAVLFILPVAHTTWYYLDQLWLKHLLLDTFRERIHLVPFILTTFDMYFLVVIVGYGTLVPNTGRRCGLVVTAMAVVPVALVAAVGFSDETIRTVFLIPFISCLVVMATWMGVAVALAVYGAYRIEILRREVQAARQLGQYRLKDRLGAGGMGEVYLAEHVLLRRPCALKLIRPERAGDPQHLRRFEREVQATAGLTHPNTVQIYDYGHADDGTFYYAMEYLPGMNLDELVKRHGPLPPERAVHLLLQVCGALREAHAAGLIHRDIKPSNVIACERGGLHDVAKLLDFGLVRAPDAGADATHQTQEGAAAGTPAYMSPEQADGKKSLDARGDIYSLGALAYYLLTGQPPFVRPTPLQTLIAHLCDPPAPPDRLRPGVPADVQAVVLRCLEKDPGRRFPDVRSLEKALAACGAAGQWTEERAAAWRRDHPGASGDAVAAAEAPTRGPGGDE